jgi:hypothetical protein
VKPKFVPRKSRKKSRVGLSARSLAEVLVAIEEAPDAVERWIKGRPGRWPKVTAGDYQAEWAVAVAVERERLERCIPPSRTRTPEDVYLKVAKEHRISARSTRRFYTQHREFARMVAGFQKTIRGRASEFRELADLYGESVLQLSTSACHRIYIERKALPPSQIPVFDGRIRSIVGQKGEKTD